MKVALVHDWLTGMRGGENVLEALCDIFPEADIYTLLHIPGSVSDVIENRKIHTSFLGSLPDVERRYRWYLPIMPLAIESLDIRGYDLVISSSHCVAKGALTDTATHICYCHTPMRYAWDLYDDYFNRSRFSAPTLFAIEKIMPHLRKWDRRTVSRVDRFIANSRNVAERIKRIYRVGSDVVYPPVDTEFFDIEPGSNRDTYLVVSAFAPYKRVDLAIETFNQRNTPLTVVGSGEDEARLKAMAGPKTSFESSVSPQRLRQLYNSARALIYPGVEDFGIIPVEAMACGAPVIAYGKGGSLETVVPLRDEFTMAPTGVFFDKQTVYGLGQAIDRFENNQDKFNPETIRENALRFSRASFSDKMASLLRKYAPG